MRLLFVEDDELFGQAAHKGLVRAGYAVDWIRKGREVAVAMLTHHYDGVLLDLGLPDVSGESVLKKMRDRHSDVPVVVMTARGGIQDRIGLLDIGADDYMIKPIDLDELCARLRAVSRRARSSQGEEGDTEYGPLRLLPSRHAATWYGKPVPLTNKEYGLLETFVRRRNQVLTRAQLEEALYGWGEEVGSNAVEVYIHYLRRKFESGMIQTVRGVGYQFAVQTHHA